ncbi:unnamed protein product, partial [Hapterophycus canaliculatus]
LAPLQVRDNILFGCPFDARRYDRVLEACALKSVRLSLSASPRL